MKTIKQLDELLNKVVDFTNPGEELNAGFNSYKGYLYKDYRGYYIKVIDTLHKNQSVGDHIYLKDGDEKFITHALKPKLMVVSKKSWHYRLIKYVLKDNAPTPKTMQNGCPYFWLLIFSMLILPFLILWKIIKGIVLFLPLLFYKGLEYFTNSWIDKLDDAEAYEYYITNPNGIPLVAKIYINSQKENYSSLESEFLKYFINEKYGLSKNANRESYLKKKDEIDAKWAEWRKIDDEKKSKKYLEEYAKKEAWRKKHEAFLEKKAIREANWNKRIEPIEKAFNKLFNSIGDVCRKISNQFKTNPANWKVIIKRTKQFVGAIITLIFLAATLGLVSLLAYSLTFIIDFLVAQWIYLAFTGVITGFIGIIYVLVILFTGWAQNVVNKYKKGKKVWYIEPFKLISIYILFYPVKYIIIVIGFALLFIIWKPIELIIYKFLWNLILFPVGKWLGIKIGIGAVSLFNALISSTGIFGEYVGSGYTDYCPGLEFQDFDEED